MKMKRKSLIMLVCALMIITSMAFGTIAYLTDRAGVTNRFTIGNVDIVVDETEVDEEGQPIPDPDEDPEDPDDDFERTEEENEYPLIPGTEYVKDPTLTVKAGSEESYVRLMVTVSHMKEIKAIFEELSQQYSIKYVNGFVPGDYVTGRDNTVWELVGGVKEDETNNVFTMEFRYPNPVAPTDTEDVVLPALFETIKIPGELTYKHLDSIKDFSIEINGNAIQTTGFENAEAAWEAFDIQMEATGE